MGENSLKTIFSAKKIDRRIFLDLDGVICNWLQDYCKFLKVDDKQKELRDFVKGGKPLDKY